MTHPAFLEDLLTLLGIAGGERRSTQNREHRAANRK
jgi:hypothetical protein